MLFKDVYDAFKSGKLCRISTGCDNRPYEYFKLEIRKNKNGLEFPICWSSDDNKTHHAFIMIEYLLSDTWEIVDEAE